MLLKKLMHHFCGRSLEKEAAKVDALVREAEVREEAAMHRLKAQADDYRSQVAAYRADRDAELNAFVAFMGSQVRQAESYVACLGDFQDKMFVCFDSWMKTSIVQQQMQLLHDKTTTKRQLLDFIRVLQTELETLIQRDERSEWHAIIKERPIPSASPLIERSVRQVNKALKSSNDAIRRDMARLKSHATRLRTELDALRHERDSHQPSWRRIIDAHREHKADLDTQHRACGDLFNRIRDRFSDNVGAAATSNPLTDRWIAEIGGMVTLGKLIILHQHTAGAQMELRTRLDWISSEFKYIRSRIEESRRTGDYSTFDEDKATRDRLFHERSEVREQRREIVDARDVLQGRINEVKSMLAHFTSLHPDESIRQCVEIFDMDDDFDMYRAIGVITIEDRKKHYARKKQRRPA